MRFLNFVALFWIVDAVRPRFGLALKAISFSEIARFKDRPWIDDRNPRAPVLEE
jgi:hypothetical protein